MGYFAFFPVFDAVVKQRCCVVLHRGAGNAAVLSQPAATRRDLQRHGRTQLRTLLGHCSSLSTCRAAPLALSWDPPALQMLLQRAATSATALLLERPRQLPGFTTALVPSRIPSTSSWPTKLLLSFCGNCDGERARPQGPGLIPVNRGLAAPGLLPLPSSTALLRTLDTKKVLALRSLRGDAAALMGS